ncbi:hypothetical protein BDV98DRAFT_573742 [Pterulicium gracile]|uniref:Uncharacterized protein n=1 Tax=Pterulicium gracile TaxID=1884261 RepID=A0A5C3Q7F3_9AGAR|nr:hypothetical protein BDV98DRAFT_573742 [Pterula gracilis]
MPKHMSPLPGVCACPVDSRSGRGQYNPTSFPRNNVRTLIPRGNGSGQSIYVPCNPRSKS